ncbi:Envelope glycoprotein [Cricetulus griseus]|uniref:Envelope glycoprotein n=1 Tax=Cricetulus griseus TaxID=10029 RepID=G3I6C8_CRIGR|nr:Envelope glycoprotein [Cricetulus griseus]
MSNGSANSNWLNCTQTTCFYALGWNATAFPLAVVTRLPWDVLVPVEAPSSLTLFREKRDFGITAAIVTAITVDAVSTTVSAVALSGTVQTGNALKTFLPMLPVP